MLIKHITRLFLRAYFTKRCHPDISSSATLQETFSEEQEGDKTS